LFKNLVDPTLALRYRVCIDAAGRAYTTVLEHGRGVFGQLALFVYGEYAHVAVAQDDFKTELPARDVVLR
jgi:hypothetical protein